MRMFLLLPYVARVGGGAISQSPSPTGVFHAHVSSPSLRRKSRWRGDFLIALPEWRLPSARFFSFPTSQESVEGRFPNRPPRVATSKRTFHLLPHVARVGGGAISQSPSPSGDFQAHDSSPFLRRKSRWRGDFLIALPEWRLPSARFFSFPTSQESVEGRFPNRPPRVATSKRTILLLPYVARVGGGRFPNRPPRVATSKRTILLLSYVARVGGGRFPNRPPRVATSKRTILLLSYVARVGGGAIS